MPIVDTAVGVVHLLVGALWVGSVIFFTAVVLPLARGGEMDATPVASALRSLTTWSRVASVLMLLTGGHLAAARYDAASLAGTDRGLLVLAMTGLWLAFTVLVEVAAGRARGGLDRRKVRAPVREASPWFRVASLVGVLLLIDAGLLFG